MTYQDKLQSARSIVDEHNENAPKENQINFDEFLSKLKGAGGTSEAALAASSWEDLVECGLPKLLAKQVAGVFRQKEEAESKNPYRVSPSKAKKMSPKELIENYNPDEPDSHVAERLNDISKGYPFIVFDSADDVDVEYSLNLFNELKQGFPPRDFYAGPSGGDFPRKVYAIGDAPGKTLDENPLRPGLALRPDGSCTETSVNWSSVDLETRQFIRVGRDMAEIKIRDKKDLFELIKTSKEDLMKIYTATTVRFAELKDEGKLPSLKIKKNGSKKAFKVNDPFHGSSGHRSY